MATMAFDLTIKTAEDVAAAHEEAAANAARQARDRLLSACDWTQVADAPVDQQAWATYRQALRDIPDQLEFPHTIQWPQEPA